MAWRCSGRTNAELIANLQANSLIRSARVADAMCRVDRKHYVPAHEPPYQDSPQPIGHGATISAPHMHAEAIEHLADLISKNGRILDVGSGSGFLLAVFWEMCQSGAPDGRQMGPRVVGIDHVQALSDMAARNLVADGRANALKTGEIKIVTGDGRLGYPQGGPYDVIHVGAAAPKMPQALIDQLATPGRMFIPVGTFSQAIIQVDKDAKGNVTERKIMGVRYIPLCDRDDQTASF